MSGADQGSLELIIQRPLVLASEEVVRAQATPLKAFNTQIDMAGGEKDLAIYAPLGVDSAQFSRWRSGQQTPQFNRIEVITRMCGVPLLIQKLAWDCGFGLHMLKSEAEKRADELQKRLHEAELENRVLMKALGATK